MPIQGVIIEFDGKQHYWASETSSWATPEKLEQINFRDTVKNDWCGRNGGPLIRIPYTELKKLDAAYISALVETASAERENVFVPLPDAECDMRPVKF